LSQSGPKNNYNIMSKYFYLLAPWFLQNVLIPEFLNSWFK